MYLQRYKELQRKWLALSDAAVGRIARGCLIPYWCRAAGARAAYAVAAAKRAGWTEIAGDRGAGCVGGER
jgi:hypothetical protein